MKKIGLVAGSGQFPIIFSDILVSKNISVYTVAYAGEADPRLSKNSAKIEWMHLGQVGRLIEFFKKNDIKQAVMLGAIKKTKLFKNIKPDFKAIAIIKNAKTTHDNAIMCSFAEYLEKFGIIIEASTIFTPELIATKGIWTKRKPSQPEYRDIEIGIHVAEEIGRLDIGQSIVVGQGSVLAVEAIDGTNATIKRGGSLTSKKAVLVKVCKPNQDKRFDIPAVGLETVKKMYEGNIGALAIKSNETVIFDKDEMIKEANKHNISLVCF